MYWSRTTHSIRAMLDHGKYRYYIKAGNFERRALIFNESYEWIISFLK